MFPSTPQLDYNAVVGVHVKKICVITDCLITRDRCSNWLKSLTRPLYQVFTYVNKCPTNHHLVWDISQWYLVL